MTDKVLFDSNILIYAADLSEVQKRAIAKGLVDECFEQKRTAYLSLQNISEFYAVVTGKIERPLATKDAERICRMLIEFEGFVKLTPATTTIMRAIEMNAEYGIEYWDCLIAATMIENGIKTVYTENTKDFEKLPGIKAINPFTTTFP